MKTARTITQGRKSRLRPGVFVWATIALMIPAHRAWAQSSGTPQLAGASLEELMNIEVTSVSKKEQTLSKTAAAVFVISQDDIQHSGAKNIPDLLRMAPGVEVAQIDANQWAISIRGFNDLYSDKVLVLVDGRTVYVNTFSGVFWDQINVPLEDIDRIEIIRGPGGTVWGANAVNGVINIITKSAADTKGGFAAASTGTRQTADELAQYGGDAGSTGAYRVFGRYFNTDNSVFPGGHTAADGSHGDQAGARADWSLSPADTLSVQGDFLFMGGGGTSAAIFTGPPPFETSVNNLLRSGSGDVLARWEHTGANGSSTSVQIYDDAIERSEAGAHLNNNALDVDFENRLTVGSRHDVVWGLDYRVTRDNESAGASYALGLIPAQRTDNLFAAFVQDEIRLGSSVFVTLGSKFEHNAYTGFEYEPSAQMVWKINDRHSLWGSAARAIRQPDRVDTGVDFNVGIAAVPGGGTALVVLSGSAAVQPERLLDYEAGYRAQVNPRLSVDFTAYLSFYKHLETQEPGTPYVTGSADNPLVILPLTFASLAHARDYGAELFANWRATSRWKLSPGFSMLRMSVAPNPASQDSSIGQTTAGYSPRQQFELRSMLRLPKNLSWDSSIKYVSRLDGLNIPGYARLDARLAWRPGESWELSISGQNLATRRHLEFMDDSGLFLQTEVARTVSGKVTWRF